MKKRARLNIEKSITNYRLYTTSLFLIITTAIIAQNGSIKGIITDTKTNEILIGASVLVEGTTFGAAADLDGNFEIHDVPAGTYVLKASYVAYKPSTKTNIVVERNQETIINIELSSDDYALDEIVVVAQANRESENILLLEQRKTLVARQSVGARELSRKGLGNAEAAVAQISGISKQEGVKNVFVRGLGDRYNMTKLNGFPIPSEDPEYKNIALEFFSTNIIQNIGVSKVFNGNASGDVGGAIIDITSKKLFGEQSFGINLSAGFNDGAIGDKFIQQVGSNYLGFANKHQPADGIFDFSNSLDPSTTHPIDHSFGISGGRLFKVGENNNPLSFFIVATQNTDYSFTKEYVRNTTTNGTITQDQVGDKYSRDISQIILSNANLLLNKSHNLQYNFMMVHANNQYVGEYIGKHSDRHQEPPFNGFLRRQQTNENLLFTHQLLTNWELTDRVKLDVSASYNTINGLEPDRRENNLTQNTDNTFFLTGSNLQKRFFSTLKENDFNVRSGISYKLNDNFDNQNSLISIGYAGRFVDDQFDAVEYNFSAFSSDVSIEPLKLDNLYNAQNLDSRIFTMTKGDPNSYYVKKIINSGYIDASYQFSKKLIANLGFRLENVDMTVNHDVQHAIPGSEKIKKNYFLPSLNIKYDLNDKNTVRVSASRTYTLPQSKEISPFQYVSIGFVSQGDPNIQPSKNYHADLKWDYYMSPSELLSITGFYKYILNPIARVDEGNAAGLLTYTNISHHANVAGIELEMRKNIYNRINTSAGITNRLSIGINASYILSSLKVDIRDTPVKKAQLEGASPFISNADISYNYMKNDKNITTSLILNYFSDRVHTIGSRTYENIIEEGVPTLNFAFSYRIDKNFTIKLNISNILDPSYNLSRKVSGSDESIKLNELKKGRNFSIGFSYEL